MDPRRFMLLARTMAAEGEPEHARTAISRAYYAVYNVAIDMLRALQIEVASGQEGHEAVRERLRATTVDRVMHVGAELRKLRSLRVKADYWMRDPQPESSALANEWLLRAEQMIADLDTAVADLPTRERMTRALQAWQQGRGRPNR
jgi:hypothetical protein